MLNAVKCSVVSVLIVLQLYISIVTNTPYLVSVMGHSFVCSYTFLQAHSYVQNPTEKKTKPTKESSWLLVKRLFENSLLTSISIIVFLSRLAARIFCLHCIYSQNHISFHIIAAKRSQRAICSYGILGWRKLLCTVFIWTDGTSLMKNGFGRIYFFMAGPESCFYSYFFSSNLIRKYFKVVLVTGLCYVADYYTVLLVVRIIFSFWYTWSSWNIE